MGQTLTHGVYLPDEGERNCYSGLAGNWQILDSSVGTIAANTTALSGKAPLVHTHTKSDITDFPAYGNAAGTICEGNDARLSDARTPVAHTHGKADITDLFNSANTWTANNTYSAKCIIYNSDSSGSVAGLNLRNSKAEVLSTGNTSSDQSMTFRDKNDVAIGYIKGAVQSNSVALKIGSYAKDSSNNTVNTELQLLAYSNGNKAIFPSTTKVYDLGLSSYKWKTLNGINPGALSLPDNSVYYSFNTDNFVYTGAYNEVTVPKKGWLYLRLVECNQDAYIACSSANGNVDYPVFSVGTILNQNTSKYEVNFLMPLSMTTFRLYIYKTQGTLTQHKVFYTEGMIQ